LLKGEKGKKKKRVLNLTKREKSGHVPRVAFQGGGDDHRTTEKGVKGKKPTGQRGRKGGLKPSATGQEEAQVHKGGKKSTGRGGKREGALLPRPKKTRELRLKRGKKRKKKKKLRGYGEERGKDRRLRANAQRGKRSHDRGGEEGKGGDACQSVKKEEKERRGGDAA